MPITLLLRPLRHRQSHLRSSISRTFTTMVSRHRCWIDSIASSLSTIEPWLMVHDRHRTTTRNRLPAGPTARQESSRDNSLRSAHGSRASLVQSFHLRRIATIYVSWPCYESACQMLIVLHTDVSYACPWGKTFTCWLWSGLTRLQLIER